MSKPGNHGAVIIPFPTRATRGTRPTRAPGAPGMVERCPDPGAAMTELLGLMTADGADVVAFARAVPARFRGRLPADLRLAAGLPNSPV